MKQLSRLLAVGLTALTLLSASTGMAAAKSCGTAPKVQVIRCGKGDCPSVESVIQQLCSGKGCKVNTVVKSGKGYCPGGNCSTAAPAKAQTKPSAPAKTESSQKASDFNAAYEKEVVRLVNVQRAKYGLSALTQDSGAQKVARVRAKEIVQSFSHSRPNGQSCFTAAGELGVSYRTAGENIAYGYATPQQVVDGWMHSEGHRKNILSSSFTKIGVGCCSKGGTLYWSQFFIG